MERKVFLEMSPVIFERYLTHEEIDDFQRRAKLPASRQAAYIGLPLVCLLLVLVLRENELVSHGVAFLLTLVVIACLAIGILWVRDLRVEAAVLKSVGLGSKVLTFRNLGYWPTFSHFTALGPPDTVDVLFPERLVIASDNKPLKTCKPIKLTLFEDLPWPEKGAEFRNLTAMERQEIERRLRAYRSKVWASIGGLVLGALMLLSATITWIQGDFPGIVDIVAGPFGIWYASGNFREAIRMERTLQKTKTYNRVSISWEGDLLREHLFPDQLVWRDETGPASWRRVSDT